jgi:hypothetical protein
MRAQARKKIHIDRQLVEDFEDESGTFWLNLTVVCGQRLTTRLPCVVLLVLPCATRFSRPLVTVQLDSTTFRLISIIGMHD